MEHLSTLFKKQYTGEWTQSESHAYLREQVLKNKLADHQANQIWEAFTHAKNGYFEIPPFILDAQLGENMWEQNHEDVDYEIFEHDEGAVS